MAFNLILTYHERSHSLAIDKFMIQKMLWNWHHHSMETSWSSLLISLFYATHLIGSWIIISRRRKPSKNVHTRSNSMNSFRAIMSEPISSQPVMNIPVCTRNPSIFIDRTDFMTKIEIIRNKYAIAAYISFLLKIHDYLDQPLTTWMVLGQVKLFLNWQSWMWFLHWWRFRESKNRSL